MTAPAYPVDEHVFSLRVYYEDTDAGGIVYYANYLKFAERARTEALRGLGFDNPSLLDREGVFFVVRRGTIDFRMPARLDDRLDVVTRITDYRGASVAFRQTIRRHGRDVCRMAFVLACVSVDGRPARLPASFRAALDAAGARQATSHINGWVDGTESR